MTRGPLRVVVACLLAVLALAGAAVPLAFAADAPAPAPAPSPAPAPAPSPAPAPAPAAQRRAPGMTQDQLEAVLQKRPGAFVVMVVLKWGAAIAGGILLVLGFVRRRDERAGLVAPERAPSPPPAPYAPMGAIALWVALFAFQQVAVMAVRQAVPSAVDGPAVTWPWAFGLTATGFAVVGGVIAARLRRARRAEGRTPWPMAATVALGGKGWLVATALAIPVTFAWVAILKASGQPLEVQDLVSRTVREDVEPAFLLALGVLAVLVAPVTEELLFRGALFGSLRARIGSRAAALISSVLFAAVHSSVFALVPLFVLALVLCWVYERSGSLVAPIVVHMLNNATSLLPLFLVHL